MHNKDEAWRYGVVSSIAPLEVRLTFGKSSHRWDFVEKSVTFAAVQGRWRSLQDGAVWRIDEKGEAYLNGKRSDPGGDLVEDDAIIKRNDGWEVDMANSTMDQLIWVKGKNDKYEPIKWGRLSTDESKLLEEEEKAAALEEEEEEEGNGDTTFRKPLQQTACRGCWERKGTSICRRCNKVKYCSSECQKRHWSVHKQFCGKGDGHLRVMWTSMASEGIQEGNKGCDNLIRQRQFMHHVGGNFDYSNNGMRIFHAMTLHVCGILKRHKTKRIRKEYETILQEAFDLEADPNAKCCTGDTPLHMACNLARMRIYWSSFCWAVRLWILTL